MIEILTIDNFQSHKKTTLALHPNVNVIVGSSDSGKSAILRAFNWLLKNRPAGDSYRSNWGGITHVGLLLNSETDIAHTRTDKEGKYSINGLELKATGTEPPEEIKNALQFDDELNIQYQHDSPFGLSFTSGEMAKLLNRIANIDKIDTGLSEIEKQKRRNNSTLTHNQEQLEAKNKLLDAVPDLVMMEENLSELEEKFSTFEENRMEYQKLIMLSMEIEEKDKVVQQYKNVDKAEKRFIKINKNYSEWNDLCIKYSANSFLINDIIKTKDILKNIPDVKALEKIQERLLALKEKEIEKWAVQADLDLLIDTVSSIRVEEGKIHCLTSSLEKAEKEFKKEMGDVCVLCGRPIEEKHIHE